MNKAKAKQCILWATIAVSTLSIWAATPVHAGRVIAWGWNYYGQCDAPAGDDFVAVAANWKHSLALRSDGTVVGWGQNNQGQSDPPPGNDFVAVSAGLVHSLALRADGSLYAWGYDGNGECKVPPGNDFVDIDAGDHHNLALRSDGSIVAWGESGGGLSDVPPGNGYIAISAGHRSSAAVRADGSLVVWGSPICSLSDGPGDCNTPTGSDFVGVSTDGFIESHAVALRSDGSLVAWGGNSYGQLNVPQGKDFIGIGAGSHHGVAVGSDGSVVAWGLNDEGQCNVPVGIDAVAVAGGSKHTIALLGEPTTEAPIADAGPDIAASANEEVLLDANASTAPAGEIILYTWTRLPDGVVIYSGPDPNCTTRALGRAEEMIRLTVTDNSQVTASDTMVIVNRMLQNIKDLLDSMKVSDLNQDRSVDMLDMAVLAETWLR